MEQQFHHPRQQCQFCCKIGSLHPWWRELGVPDWPTLGDSSISLFEACLLEPRPSRLSCPYQTLLFEASARLMPDAFYSNGHLRLYGPHPVTADTAGIQWLKKDNEKPWQIHKSIEIYGLEGNESLTHVKSAVDISHDNSDPETWRFVQHQIECCLSTHPLCKAQQTSWRPRYLLRISASELVLQSTNQSHPHLPYAALSYCWGGDQSLKLGSSTLAELEDGVSSVTLPQVFQNAIQVCQRLGIEYLWIDALCIMQDDARDWARQSGDMQLVYQNAFIVIAAASSPRVNVPFLGPLALNKRFKHRSIELNASRYFEGESKLRARISIDRDEVRGAYSTDNPLDQRGWAFQERHAATRYLKFAQTELVWECMSKRVHESYPAFELPFDHPHHHARKYARHSRKDQQGWISGWRDAINQYSPRRLTVLSDRLPAISGVASMYHEVIGGEYLAGIWSLDLARSLAWHFEAPESRTISRMPSWSWISCYESTVAFGGDTDDSGFLDSIDTSRVALLGSKCEPSSSNIYGDIKPGATLVIRGPVIFASLAIIHKKNGREPMLKFDDVTVVGDLTIVYLDGKLMRSPVETNDKGEEGQTWRRMTEYEHGHGTHKYNGNGGDDEASASLPVLCLQLWTGQLSFDRTYTQLLILSAISIQPPRYQRIGLASYYSRNSVAEARLPDRQEMVVTLE